MFSSTMPLSERSSGWVDRLFPIRGFAMAAMLFLAIGVAGYLSVEYAKRKAHLVVEDTLAGLRDSSQADAALVQAFNSTLLMVMADTPEERIRFCHQCALYDAQVNDSVTSYVRSIFTGEDRCNYNQLLELRKRYAAVEKKTHGLVIQQQSAEAMRVVHAELVPAYRDYKAAADRVMKYNADEGQTRGKAIMEICTVTQYVIAGAGIVLFMTGFAMGVFK
jgi:hypothetical protein